MTDASEISALIEKENHSMDDFPAYTDKQLVYIEDSNMGTYSSGQIKLEPASNMKTCWSTLSDAYLLLPINVAGVGTVLTAASLIACKQSVLSFINSVLFQANNVTVLNETDINIINNLKLLTKYSYEWQTEVGPELHASVDTSKQVTNASSNTSIVNDVTVNSGFADRVKFFKQSSSFNAGVFSTVVKIPLRYIHDLFAQMDFPMINFDYKFSFGVNMYQNNNFAPMVKDITVPVGTTGLTCTIGSALMPGSQVMLNKVRLYYHTVEFDASLNQKLYEKIKSGFSKKVYFTQTDTYLPTAGEVGPISGTISRTLSSCVVHPLRVWILGVPTTALSGSGNTAADTGLCCPVAAFNNVNVKINGKLYYNVGLDNPVELWDVLSEQFPTAGVSSAKRGGCINYSQFLSGQRYTLLDVSRDHGRLDGPSGTSEIIVSATRDGSNVAACDYYYMVERLGCATFMINDQKARVDIGLTN